MGAVAFVPDGLRRRTRLFRAVRSDRPASVRRTDRGRAHAVYTIGFFAFWVIGAVSSAITVFLAQSPFEVNRCTLEADERPLGCPKRCEDDPDARVERA